jgi:hypothetical protein
VGEARHGIANYPGAIQMSQLAWDILLTLFFLFLGGVFLLFVVISGALTVVT